MKQFHIKKWLFAIMATGILFTSCNKDVPTPEPIPGPPIPTGNTIGQVITTDTTYSYLLAAVTRVGLSDALFTQTLNFTVFAPNNAAFRASGIPSIAVINALPLSTLVPLTQYHILGFKMPGASIPETFPNTLALTLFAPPGAPAPFVRVSNFPSRRGTAGWVNNIPITQADIAASNGVIHSVARVLAPPSQTMSALITADTTLTFLKAAITRADSGQTGLNRLDSVLNTPIGPNLTLFAPNNNAFRALLTALGLPPSTAAFRRSARSSTTGARLRARSGLFLAAVIVLWRGSRPKCRLATILGLWSPQSTCAHRLLSCPSQIFRGKPTRMILSTDSSMTLRLH